MSFKGKKILVTGASGFIGSFLVERALAEGAEVWAGVRKSSSRGYLTHPDIHFIELDFGNPDILIRQMENFKCEHGVWDYVVHAAGLTKSVHESDFYAVNCEGTVRLANVLVELDMRPRRFVMLSTLSVFGPIREKRVKNAATPYAYSPIESSDHPRPNTAYGKSKWAAERQLLEIKDLSVVILRPTGVYGPREKDYFLMAKSIAGGVDFAVGFRRQEITFVYVSDVVDAVFLAFERGQSGSCYFLSDGQVYDSRTYSDLLKKELGVRRLLRLTAPVWFLWLVCFVSGNWAKLRGKTSTLNTDKFHILKQRNWQCNISAARHELGYEPKVQLPEGVRRTVAWYKKEKWI